MKYIKKLIQWVKEKSNWRFLQNAINNNKKNITTYDLAFDLANKNDIEMIYDDDTDHTIWVVKVIKIQTIFVFSIEEKSQEFIIKILRKHMKPSNLLLNSILYNTDLDYIYHDLTGWKFKTTDGIITFKEYKNENK
jgi:hypothetical protein